MVGSVSPRMTHPEFGQHIFMNPSPNRLRSLLCLVDALPILIFTCCRRAKGKVTESLAPRLGGMCLFWRFYVAFGCLSRALEHSVALCEDRIRGFLPFFGVLAVVSLALLISLSLLRGFMFVVGHCVCLHGFRAWGSHCSLVY